MNEPWWKIQHDWWVSDFKEWVENKLFFVQLLRRHPGDKNFIDTVKSIEKIVGQMQKDYKKIYGVRMNLRKLEESTHT